MFYILSLFLAKGSKYCNYSRLYRLLRADEDPEKDGITPRRPDADESVNYHVLKGSSFPSQFISTSASRIMVRAFANHREPINKRIATINVDKLKTMDEVYFIDLTEPGNRNTYLSKGIACNRARKYDEVLILGDIPSSCVEKVEVIKD